MEILLILLLIWFVFGWTGVFITFGLLTLMLVIVGETQSSKGRHHEL